MSTPMPSLLSDAHLLPLIQRASSDRMLSAVIQTVGRLVPSVSNISDGYTADVDFDTNNLFPQVSAESMIPSFSGCSAALSRGATLRSRGSTLRRVFSDVKPLDLLAALTDTDVVPNPEDELVELLPQMLDEISGTMSDLADEISDTMPDLDTKGTELLQQPSVPSPLAGLRKSGTIVTADSLKFSEENPLLQALPDVQIPACPASGKQVFSSSMKPSKLRPGSKARKNDGTFNREVLEVLSVYIGAPMIFYLNERYFGILSAGACFADWLWFSSALKWIIRVCIVFFLYVVHDAYHKWNSYFKNRKHRYESGCQSFSRIPKIGQKEQKDWKSTYPTRDTQRGVLDMDHVRLDFLDFLWAHFFVSFALNLCTLYNSVTLGGRGSFMKFVLRRWKQEQGIEEPKDLPDPRKTFAEIALESTMAIYYNGTLTPAGKGHGVLADFTILNSHIYDKEGMSQSGTFKYTVDLDEKALVHATWQKTYCPRKGEVSSDPIPLAPEDALLLINTEMYLHGHPQMHAFANWGLSPYSSDPNVARYSKISVMYNHMGFVGFGEYLAIMKSIGVAKYVHSETHVAGSQGAAVRIPEGAPRHASIKDLAPYSEYVDFMIKVREYFIKEFHRHEYAEGFQGIHPEALFLATVMHSVDHNQGYIADQAELISKSELFKPNEELINIAFAVADGDGDDGWFLWDVSMKNSPHKFFRKVYNFAKTVNKKFADKMQTAIAK